MESSIIKSTELSPASFDSNARGSIQVRLVASLIRSSIEQQRPITKDDIINCYMDFLEKSGRQLKYHEYLGWNAASNRGSYRLVILDRDKYRQLYSTPTKAKQWFRANLGSAIIQGKLLVIPIIEIE